MTNAELRLITSDFEDVKPVIDKRKIYKKEEERLRRKLKSLQTKYSFLKTLVDIDCAGTPLVNAVKQLFVEMQFKKIENVDKKYLDEDLRLWTEDNRLLIFEITGIDKQSVTDSKALQIAKHLPIRKTQNPDKKVHAVFVVNYENKKSYVNRNPKPFNNRLITLATAQPVTLLTTTDLFNAFVLYKKNQLTKEGLIDKLCKGGELKISGTP